MELRSDSRPTENVQSAQQPGGHSCVQLDKGQSAHRSPALRFSARFAATSPTGSITEPAAKERPGATGTTGSHGTPCSAGLLGVEGAPRGGVIRIRILRAGATETAMRHGLEDVELGLDPGGEELAVHPNGV